jgi:hypothetical protein
MGAEYLHCLQQTAQSYHYQSFATVTASYDIASFLQKRFYLCR